MSQRTKNKNDGGGGHSQKTNYGQKKNPKSDLFDEEKKNDTSDQFSGLVDRYGFLVSKRNNGENDNNNNKDNDDKKYSSKLENSLSKEFLKGFQILGEVQLGKRTLEILIEKQNEEELIQLYKNLLVTSSSHEIQINLDIPRTTRSHIMFISEDSAGQKSLFNILKAFSNHDQQVGYCQGMASIAFVMLIRLFNKLKLHDLYIPGFPSLLESFYIQEMLMEKYALKISKHLKKNEIRTATYATRWYLTLFTSEVVPHHTLLRFWDLLMLYGFDISYYIAVGLLKYNKYKLINFDFDDTMLKKTA
nr:7934_t:CDS:10 [Entrophospora candida]